MHITFKKVLSALIPAGILLILIFVLKNSQSDRTGSFRTELTPDEIGWIDEASSMILTDYVDEVDPEALAYSALEGMVTSLDDYGAFYRRDDGERFRETAEGRHAGPGIRLDPYARGIVVRYPAAGSPAERAGLRPGDGILEIDGKKTDGMAVKEAESLLRGPVGSTCRLVVRFAPSSGRAGDEILEVDRAEISEDSIFNERFLDEKAGIAYLRIKNFNNGTRGALDAAVQAIEERGARSLVIDLRFNPGGPLKSALNTANLFQGEGVLLRTRGRAAESNRTHRASPSLLAHPGIRLVLLVNGSTVSAAEVFAGTLQDHKRAVLIGSRTFGKGVIQTAVTKNFGEPVVIKITTARYYTPEGRCIDRSMGAEGGLAAGGIEPDLSIPMDDAAQKELKRFLRKREVPNPWLEEALGAEAAETCRDAQIEAALRFLKGEETVPPVDSTKGTK